MAFQRPLIEIFNFLGEHAPRLSTPPLPPSPSSEKIKAAFYPATFLPRVPRPSKSYATSLQAATCCYTEGGRFMNRGSTVLAY